MAIRPKVVGAQGFKVQSQGFVSLCLSVSLYILVFLCICFRPAPLDLIPPSQSRQWPTVGPPSAAHSWPPEPQGVESKGSCPLRILSSLHVRTGHDHCVISKMFILSNLAHFTHKRPTQE